MVAPSAATDVIAEPNSGARTARWGAVYAMTLCTFVLVASEFMPMSLLSPIAHDLQLSEGRAGEAIAISGLFAVITSLSLTRLIGTLNRRAVLLGLTALLIVSGTLVAFAPSYPVLMLGRAVVGVAIGGFWSLSAAMAMRMVPPASVPKALAVMNGGNAIASTVAAPLGSFMGGLIGWRGAFFSVVPLAVAAVIWQFFALPSLPATSRGQSTNPLSMLQRRHVAIGFLGTLLLFTGQFSLFTYLRPFLEQVTHVNLATLSSLLLVVGFMGFIGTVLIGRMIGDQLHILLAVLPAIMAVVAVGLGFYGGSIMVAAPLLAIWGLTGTAAPVAWWTWVTRAAPDDAEAGGGLMVAVAQIGITLGATLGGMAYDSLGPVVTFMGSAAILAVGAVVAFASGQDQASPIACAATAPIAH
jgi:predicted MFS family arabinose efflux permease